MQLLFYAHTNRFRHIKIVSDDFLSDLFCEESGWDFRPLFLRFAHTLNVLVIQETGDMCCSTYVGSVLTVIVYEFKDKVKEDSDPIVKECNWLIK